MRRVLYSTLAIALLMGSSFAQEKVKGASAGETSKQWQTDFPSLITELTALLVQIPESQSRESMG
jgi:hypothetical protein